MTQSFKSSILLATWCMGILPLAASLGISKTGISEASVTIRDEVLTVSAVMKEVTYYQHYNGVAKLYLRAGTQLTIDESIYVNRGGELKGNAELIYQDNQTCLTIGGNGSQFSWGSSTTLTIVAKPTPNTIPEPTTAVFALLGVLGTALTRRRREQ